MCWHLTYKYFTMKASLLLIIKKVSLSHFKYVRYSMLFAHPISAQHVLIELSKVFPYLSALLQYNWWHPLAWILQSLPNRNLCVIVKVSMMISWFYLGSPIYKPMLAFWCNGWVILYWKGEDCCVCWCKSF